MRRALLRTRIAWAVGAALLVAAGMAGSLAILHAKPQAAQAPATTLGIWTSAEDNGQYSTIAGQHPNVANIYEYWGSAFPTSFADTAWNDGATTYLEIEPWQGVVQGQSGDCSYSSDFPAMTTIGANGSAISSYLDSLGSAIASFGHPVIVTFAHEFNVPGQYPWSTGDCEGTTPPQWVAAWDVVRSDVDSTANGLAYFMWAPNAYTGGSTIEPVSTSADSSYWPGSSEVDMVGVDGYPDTQYGSQFGTFSGEFGPVFANIHTVTSLPIFISETDLSPLDGSGYESISSFISDLCSNGGDGVLQFQEGTAGLSSTQWTELDNALASDCTSSSSASPTPSSLSPSASTPAPSSPAPSSPAPSSPTPSGSCAAASPTTSPTTSPTSFPTTSPTAAPSSFNADEYRSYRRHHHRHHWHHWSDCTSSPSPPASSPAVSSPAVSSPPASFSPSS